MNNAWYELRCNEANRLYFTLLSPTGSVLLVSDSFSERAQLLDALTITQHHFPYPINFRTGFSAGGRYYFDLLSLNREFLGTSHRFIDDTLRDLSMHCVMTFGGTRIIKDCSSTVWTGRFSTMRK